MSILKLNNKIITLGGALNYVIPIYRGCFFVNVTTTSKYTRTNDMVNFADSELMVAVVLALGLKLFLSLGSTSSVVDVQSSDAAINIAIESGATILY